MSISKTDVLGLRSSNPFLSKSEKETIERQKKIYDKMLVMENLARYKLELMFGADFSINKPSKGVLSFWESGSKLHGGGDAGLYICAGKDKGINNCEAFIPDASQGYGFLVCPSCNSKWKGSDVAGQILANSTVQNWAVLLTKYFRKLNNDADIVIKYHPSDIRSVAAKEQEKQHMGDLLAGARATRAIRIYTLKSLLADTSAGSDVESRILAFIRA